MLCPPPTCILPPPPPRPLRSLRAVSFRAVLEAAYESRGLKRFPLEDRMIRKKGRREYTAIRARLNVTCACLHRCRCRLLCVGRWMREGGSRPAGGPVSGGDAVTAATAQSLRRREGRENTVIQHILRGAPSRRGLMIFRGAEEEGPLAKCCHVTRCIKT